MKRKNPAPAGEREQGETGNIDGPYLTRPAPDIQAQFPVSTPLPRLCLASLEVTR